MSSRKGKKKRKVPTGRLSVKTCPICNRRCSAAKGNAEGFCFKIKSFRPGPIRHPELPQYLLAMIQWSYKIVGRYLWLTLEDWEVGFMQDVSVVKEVFRWHHISLAFIVYHKLKCLPLRSCEEETALIRSFLAGSGKESELVRQCLREGWIEELERCKRIAKNPSKLWTPPQGLAEWTGSA